MTAKDALRALDVAVDGIELLAKAAGLGAPAAAIAAALRTLQDALDGKTDPQVALTHLETLVAGLATNDAATDAAIARKPA